jgi:hypothetical protein
MSERLKITKNLITAALLLSSSGSSLSHTKHHAPGACDSNLWSYVHNPQRLKIIDPCITVTGVITKIEQERDGDAHVLLKPDPGYEDITNDRRFQINIRDQGGNMVTEAIPVDGVQQDFGFYVGQHVKMTGSFVSDSWHNGWLEIHPITDASQIDK